MTPLHPIFGSWLNLVEVWFGIIERQATSTAAPSAPSRTQASRSAPSSTAGTTAATLWTKTADEILASKPQTHHHEH